MNQIACSRKHCELNETSIDGWSKHDNYNNIYHYVYNTPSIGVMCQFNFEIPIDFNMAIYVKNQESYEMIHDIQYLEEFSSNFGHVFKKISNLDHITRLNYWIHTILGSKLRGRCHYPLLLINRNAYKGFFYFVCTSQQYASKMTYKVLEQLHTLLLHLNEIKSIESDTAVHSDLKVYARISFERIKNNMLSTGTVLRDVFESLNLFYTHDGQLTPRPQGFTPLETDGDFLFDYIESVISSSVPTEIDFKYASFSKMRVVRMIIHVVREIN